MLRFVLRRALPVLVAFACVALAPAFARDQGQWKYASPDIKAYFEGLRQPDGPGSCCGIADAYWADKTEPCRVTDPPECVLVAIITDTRPDSWTLPDGTPVYRGHIPIGTRVVVPRNKIRKHPIANPTEHSLIFLSIYALTVYCWEPVGGL